MTKSEGRVVANCDSCGEPIIEGTGWRRLPDPAGGWLNYHHLEQSSPSQETTPNRQHFRRDVVTIKTCVPKPSARKAQVAS